MKVIFLDFDGVLNGLSTTYKIILNIARFFGLQKLIFKFYDTYGIRTLKVFWLSRIVKNTNAKIVLSSSWRNAWYKPYEECGERGKQLQKKLKFFKIPVIDKTPFCSGKREDEIDAYLKLHPEVENFVILDDECFNIHEKFPNNLVLTSNNKVGTVYEKSGLTKKHVKQAIKILKEK